MRVDVTCGQDTVARGYLIIFVDERKVSIVFNIAERGESFQSGVDAGVYAIVIFDMEQDGALTENAADMQMVEVAQSTKTGTMVVYYDCLV